MGKRIGLTFNMGVYGRVPGFEKSVLPSHSSPGQQTLHTCREGEGLHVCQVFPGDLRPVPGPQSHQRNYHLTWEYIEGAPSFEKSVLLSHWSTKQQTLYNCRGELGSRGPKAGRYRVPKVTREMTV